MKQYTATTNDDGVRLSCLFIHISEPTRLRRISYAVFCLKKKKKILHTGADVVKSCKP